MVRLLPRIFGIDAPPAARAYEEEQKMKCDGTLHFHPNGPTSVRAAEVLNPEAHGQPLRAFRARFKGCGAIAHCRKGEPISINENSRIQKGDVLAIIGPDQPLIGYVEALGREIADPGFIK